MAGSGKLPPNFSWVVDGLLAACAYPRDADHYTYMKDQGISQIVSLTERPVEAKKGEVEFEVMHAGMADFTCPSLTQVDKFVDHVEKAREDGKALVVHCQMGRGRTGTMCACYLVYKQGLSADEAIKAVRILRPGSIETSEQEQFVHRYANELKQKNEK